MIETPPIEILAEACLADLQAYDFAANIGFSLESVRHHRNRFSDQSERPTLSLRFEQDVEADDQLACSFGETRRIATFVLIADADLASEAGGLDPTGLGSLSLMLAGAIKALRNASSEALKKADWVTVQDFAPDEHSSPDDARLVCEIKLVYRVRTDDPNVLLSRV